MQDKKAGALPCSTGMELPLLSKVPQAAHLLGLHISSLDRLIQRGEIIPIRKLRHRLIPRSEIERFLNSGGENQEKGGMVPVKSEGL